MAVTRRAPVPSAGPSRDNDFVQFRLGATGDEIKALQQHLINWGFNPGPVDGQFGRGTADALKAFQTFHKLPATGTATNLSVEYLQSNALWEATRQGFHTPGTTPNVPLGPRNLTIPPGGPAPPPGAPGGIAAGGRPPGGGATPPATPGTVNVATAASAAPPAAPPISADEYIRNTYGQMGWAKAIPELAKLLQEGAAARWTNVEFRNRLMDTEWYRTTSDTVRKWTETVGADPESAKRLVGLTLGTVKNMAAQIGVTLTDDQATEFATNVHKLGWGDPELKEAIAGQAQFGINLTGDIGAHFRTVKDTARMYFQDIGDDTAFNFARDMAAGKIDVDNVTGNFINQAVGLLPALAEQIKAGQTPRDLLDFQIQQTAKLLEINPEEVDLIHDTRFNTMLQVPDTKTGFRHMTPAEASKHVKSLDDYWKTGNAEKEVSGYFQTVKKAFGI